MSNQATSRKRHARDIFHTNYSCSNGRSAQVWQHRMGIYRLIVDSQNQSSALVIRDMGAGEADSFMEELNRGAPDPENNRASVELVHTYAEHGAFSVKPDPFAEFRLRG